MLDVKVEVELCEDGLRLVSVERSWDVVESIHET